MSYSSDFRKCVLDFVSNSGSKAEASRRFGISHTCIYKWLNAEDPLACEKPGPRSLNYDALKDFANIKRRCQYNPEASIDQIIKAYN